MKHQIYMSLMIAALCLIPNSVDADEIRSGTVIRNDVGQFGGSGPSNLFDQGGLASTYNSGTTDFDTFDPANVMNTTALGGGSDQEFFSADDTPGVTDFDLGDVFTVTKVAIWDHARTANTNATSSFNLYVSSDSNFTGALSLGNFTLLDDGVDAGSGAQIFDIPDTDGQFVRMEHLTTQGGTLFGAGEIAFGSITAVPEPSSVACIGLVGLAAYLRRRRRIA